MTSETARLLAFGDIDALLAFHTATFGTARMEGDGGDGTGSGDGAGSGSGAGDGGAGTGAGDGAPRTFTQAELDAIVARKENAAKATAAQRVADELGVTVDEAKTLIKAQKDAEAAQLTDAQKREQAAAEREQKATDRETAAAAKERTATIRGALVEAGCVAKDDLTDATRLVEIADGDVSDDDAATAVKALKERRPELFKGTAAPRPNGSAPVGAPANNGGGPTSMSERREHYRKQREAAGKTA